MGVLTDVVIADEGEAEAVATERVPAKRWRGIDAKGIDQVKLATLWARLAQRGLDVESIVKLATDFATLFEVSEEGPWVFRIPGRLVELLADLDDQHAATTAVAWASTEEFVLDRWDSGAVRSILDELRSLAREARAKKKSLLMWMSL